MESDVAAGSGDGADSDGLGSCLGAGCGARAATFSAGLLGGGNGGGCVAGGLELGAWRPGLFGTLCFLEVGPCEGYIGGLASPSRCWSSRSSLRSRSARRLSTAPVQTRPAFLPASPGTAWSGAPRSQRAVAARSRPRVRVRAKELREAAAGFAGAMGPAGAMPAPRRLRRSFPPQARPK